MAYRLFSEVLVYLCNHQSCIVSEFSKCLEGESVTLCIFELHPELPRAFNKLLLAFLDVPRTDCELLEKIIWYLKYVFLNYMLKYFAYFHEIACFLFDFGKSL